MHDVQGSPDSSPRQRHRVRKIFAILGATLVIVVGGVVLFLYTPAGRDFVVGRVASVLQQQNIDFSTDELRYNLFELRLRLGNLRIRSQEAPDLPPFASIERLVVDIGVRALLRGRYVLQSGEAEGVAVHYMVAEDGRDNLPRPPHDPEQPSEPLEYLIDQLEVRAASLRYENRAQGIDVTLPVSLMEVDGHPATDRHTITFAAADGSMVMQDRRIAIDELAGKVNVGDDDARIERLDLAAEGAAVGLTGALRQFADPHVDVAVRGAIDLGRAARLVPVTDPVAGHVEIDARATGRLAAPVVQGRVSGRDVQYRDLTDVDLTTDATYDMTGRTVRFADLELRAPFGQVSGRGQIALAETGESTVTATVSDLDAAAVMRSLDTPYVVASRVDAQIDAEWPGLEYLKATGSATASLTPTAGASRSVIPIGGRINLTAARNAVDAVLSGVTVAAADLDGRLRVIEQTTLAGGARIRVADVSRSIAVAEAVLGRPAGSLMPTRVAGALQSELQIAGTVQAPTVNAVVQAPALVVGSARGMTLNADVGYTQERLAVRHLDLEWQGATATASGTVGLSGARSLDLAVRANDLQLAELLRAVDQAQVPASGVLAVQGRVTGTSAQPAGVLTVNGSQLTAYNENWGTLSARVNMAGRQIAIADLAIDKPQPQGNGRLSGTASYHLDRRTYAVDLRSQNIRLVTFALPNGRQVRGTLQLDAQGSGSIDRPAGTVRIAATDLHVDEYAVGRVVADAVLANGQADVTAAIPTYGTTASAVIGTTSPYPTTAKLRIENLQLAALPLNLQTPLEGIVRASVNATGNLAAPDRMHATAVIDAFNGAWNQQPFNIAGPARLRYADERLAIEQLRVVAQDSTIDVQGELPLTERGPAGALSVKARGSLATLTRYAPAGTNASGSGEVLVTGTIRGTLRAIDPDLEIVITDGALATAQIQPGFSNLNLRARVSGGEAQVERLTGNWGTATLTARGNVPLELLPALPVDMPRRGGPATFTAAVQGLDLAQVPGVPSGLGGRVSVNAQLSSSRAALEALSGRLAFSELRLAFNGLTLEQQQESAIAVADGLARIERLALSGSMGTVTTTGTVALTGDRALNLETRGNLNVAAIGLFTNQLRADGEAALNIAAGGTLASPELTGFVEMRDATFIVDQPTVAAENVTARIVLAGRRFSIAELTGSLNGGTLAASGHVELGADGIRDMEVEVITADVAFDAPLDLRTLSDARVVLRRRDEEYLVEGQITIDEGGLTGDINFDEGILAAMQARRRLDLTEERNQFLERVRFNLNVDTVTPLIVDNNLARAEVTADLRLIGTPYEPGLAGRLTVLEGGEITLNERRYEVEQGVITFIGERRILPSFDLRLNTTARHYDIAIAVSGVPGETQTTLTSDPALPEPDIMAVLATGRTLDEMRGEEFEIAREQVLSYLAGRLGSQLGRGVERATGLDTVRLEPQLIANETDPTARLTVGEDIAEDLELIYSVNLADSNDQIWVAEYDVTRRFQTRGVRQSDNSYRFEIRHDVRLGGRPAPARIKRQRPIVANLTVDGNGSVSAEQVRDWLGVEEGDEFDFFKARNGVDDVEETLAEQGFLQSRVRLRREGDRRTVNLSLDVATGPRVDLVFEGAQPRSAVVDEVRTQWRRGVFDTQRLDDSIEAIRASLMADNYLQPKVQGVIEEISPTERRVRFSIDRGPRFSRVVLAFEGARGVSPDALDAIVEEQDLELQLFTDPVQVTELLERYYREQGYLVASVDEPRYEFEGSQARVVLPVNEGPRFVVRNVTADGASVLPGDALVAELPVQQGDPFLPFAAENALQHIRDVYWQRGYNDVRSDYELVLDRTAGQVDVRFEVVEGPRTIVAGIDVQGTDSTSERLVREQVELETSQPLDLAALARSRRNLYGTQAFSMVDITREETARATDASSASGTLAPDAQPGGDKLVRLNISVREVQPYQLRYGLSYDTERGLGGILDLSNHNSLGKARVLGFSSRYDGEVRDFRGYFSQPSLLYLPIATTASVYYRDERNPVTTVSNPFNVDRRGASIQQERELGDSYVLNWGLRYERARTFDPRPGALLDETLTVTPLTTTLTRETRDDVLDATRGSFSSHAFAYAPSWLGSDQAYVKYFGQYFHYIPLQRERRERFTNEILRPRFVYAGAVRLGIGRPFGGDLPRSERFLAGGSTTLRGFEQNALGGVDLAGVALGGDALFVINNELRFPLVSIVDGVVFSDIGNVFPRISEFSLSDLRETAGVGLRLRTPWFLIRGDYGLVLDRREGERRGRFYFSLGQAF